MLRLGLGLRLRLRIATTMGRIMGTRLKSMEMRSMKVKMKDLMMRSHTGLKMNSLRVVSDVNGVRAQMK